MKDWYDSWFYRKDILMLVLVLAGIAIIVTCDRIRDSRAVRTVDEDSETLVLEMIENN